MGFDRPGISPPRGRAVKPGSSRPATLKQLAARQAKPAKTARVVRQPASKATVVLPDIQTGSGYRTSKAKPVVVHGIKVDSGDILANTLPPSIHESLRRLAADNPGAARVIKVQHESIAHALGQELSGKGVIAHTLEKVAKGAEKGTTIVSSGGLVAPIPGAGTGLGDRREKHGGISGSASVIATPAPKIVGRVVKDVINFPAQAIPSVYVPVAGAVEAAQGRPARISAFAKDIQHSDPIYATGQAGVRLVKGDTAGAARSIKRAGKLASEHPGFTAVEVLGAKGAAGRGAGRVVRGSGAVIKATGRATGNATVVAAGGRISDLGAVHTRPDARAPLTGLVHRREYSPDLINKGVQVRLDSGRANAAGRKRAEADRIQRTDPDQAIRLRKKANQLDPLVASDKQIKARVNLLESRGDNLRRADVGRIDAHARAIIKQAGDKGAAPVLVATGITKASVADLVRYRGELEHAHAALKDPGKQAANVRMRRAIDVSIKHATKTGDPDLRVVLDAAKRYSTEIDQPLDRVLSAVGLLPEARGAKAKLVPYAAREMGATHGVAVEPVTELPNVRQAKAVRARTGRALQITERKAAKEQGRTQLLVEQAHGRDQTRARALVQQAAGLEDQSARLIQTSRKNMMGVRATDPLRDVGIRTDRQRSYRLKANRLGVRRNEVQVGSQGYRAGQRQVRRAAEIKARAVTLRAEADTIRNTTPAATAHPVKALDRLQRARADVLAAQHAHTAASEHVKATKAQARAIKVRKATPELLDHNGHPLSAEAIRGHLHSTREVAPSYVSQAPDALGPGAYYRASAKEPTIGSRKRTERPTLEGTANVSPEMLRAGAMKRQGLVTAAKNFRAFIGETALRDADGNVVDNLTRAKAESLKHSLEAEHGLEFEIVAVRPWAASREQINAMQDNINAAGDHDPRAVQAFRDSLAQAYEGGGEGPFTLIPKAAAKQARQHLRVLDPTDAGKVARGVRSAFTRTVLTTSPGPTFGNVVEPVFRAAVQHAGPLSTLRGIRVGHALKTLDPEAYRQLQATIGKGKVTLAATQRYVDSAQFDQGFTRQLVAGYQAVKRAPVAKQLVGAWDMWSHLVFEQINGRAEAFFRQGPMLGKVLKDAGLMDHTLLGVSKKAMHEAAAGLTDTATQALLARKLNDSYGKYSGFSPSGRKVISEYTPFAAWMLSSWTFVGKVLPRDHPALLALIASTENATADWRKTVGLDFFAGKHTLPYWLQGTVPAGSHGRVKLDYNTPAGAFSDPLGGAASLVFPQGSSLLSAMQGVDWKNKPLRNKDGSPYDPLQQALYAAGELLKSTVPAVAVPIKLKHYVTDPRALLNPVLVPPRKAKPGGASTAPDPVSQLNQLSHGGDAVGQLNQLLSGR